MTRVSSFAVTLAAALFPTVDGKQPPTPGPNGATCRTTVSQEHRPPLQHVRWILAADEDDRRILAAWCGSVGPAVLAQTPHADSLVHADSIAIVTWNTHVGGGDIARLVRDLRSGRLTGAPVENFVLLLQEVHRAGGEIPAYLSGMPAAAGIFEKPAAGDRADVVHAAAALELNVFYAPSMRNGNAVTGEREDRGNAILSPFVLQTPLAIELPVESQRRVAVGARVRGLTTSGAPWQLTLANVHLDTRTRWRYFYSSFGGGRRRQAQGLVRALPNDSALVVAGDLNTWAGGTDEPAVAYLRNQFPSTRPADVGVTFRSGRLRSRLDYMFFRLPPGWRAEYRRLDEMYGSDHYPLLGWVHFNSPQ